MLTTRHAEVIVPLKTFKTPEQIVADMREEKRNTHSGHAFILDIELENRSHGLIVTSNVNDYPFRTQVYVVYKELAFAAGLKFLAKVDTVNEEIEQQTKTVVYIVTPVSTVPIIPEGDELLKARDNFLVSTKMAAMLKGIRDPTSRSFMQSVERGDPINVEIIVTLQSGGMKEFASIFTPMKKIAPVIVLAGARMPELDPPKITKASILFFDYPGKVEAPIAGKMYAVTIRGYVPFAGQDPKAVDYLADPYDLIRNMFDNWREIALMNEHYGISEATKRFMKTQKPEGKAETVNFKGAYDSADIFADLC